MHKAKARDHRQIVLATIVVGALALLVVGLSLYSSERSSHYATWASAVTAMEVEVTSVRLGVEELMAGDHAESPDKVLGHLGKTEELFTGLSEGADTPTLPAMESEAKAGSPR